MTPSQACIDLVKRFEGCRLDAYPDPASHGAPWTIGWGSTGKGIAKGTRWTQAQCDQRLAEDLNHTGIGVTGLLQGHPTSQHEFDALVSLAFNIGLGALGTSTLLRTHKAGDHTGAVGQFTRWNKASGRVMSGLTLRRIAEARLYRGLSA